MNFSKNQAIEMLSSTPSVLNTQLNALSAVWTHTPEGPDQWSVFDIVGHLVHGEKTDWTNRIKIIMGNQVNKTFPPFDRFAQLLDNKDKSLQDLLDEFQVLRTRNLDFLKSIECDEAQLARTGIHPALGEVTLRNLLSTWVAHDLNHCSQINRVMAKRYSDDVGPWKEYLPILNR